MTVFSIVYVQFMCMCLLSSDVLNDDDESESLTEQVHHLHGALAAVAKLFSSLDQRYAQQQQTTNAQL